MLNRESTEIYKTTSLHVFGRVNQICKIQIQNNKPVSLGEQPVLLWSHSGRFYLQTKCFAESFTTFVFRGLNSSVKMDKIYL